MSRLTVIAGSMVLLGTVFGAYASVLQDRSLTCDGWKSRWAREGPRFTRPMAVEFAANIPRECTQLIEEANARIRVLTPQPAPSPNIAVRQRAASPEAPTPDGVPGWKRQPSPAEMSRFYPKDAVASRTAGSALIECRIGISGFPYKCTLVSELPAGMGFGEQALAMSRLFEFKPAIRNGQPVDGGTVRIPIDFTLPVVAPAPTPTIPAQFRHKPSWPDVLRAYPELRSLEGKGALYLDCRLATNGTVYDCKAEGYGSEDPVLVQGALKMSRLFKLDPPLRDGKPALDSRITIPILFGTASGPIPPSR